jgi:hypothetical protein
MDGKRASRTVASLGRVWGQISWRDCQAATDAPITKLCFPNQYLFLRRLTRQKNIAAATETSSIGTMYLT